MKQHLAQDLPVHILGLSVAVQAADGSLQPRAEQHGIPLFGNLRWRGWADAILGGYADRITVIGGIETLEPERCPAWFRRAFPIEEGLLRVPRGLACGMALTERYGVPVERIGWCLSEGNTGGNISTIGQLLDTDPDALPVVSSSHYHLPRAMLDLCVAGQSSLRGVPAEAYTVARATRSGVDRGVAQRRLIEELGGGPLAHRAAAEICGVADKLNGTYEALSR